MDENEVVMHKLNQTKFKYGKQNTVDKILYIIYDIFT